MFGHQDDYYLPPKNCNSCHVIGQRAQQHQCCALFVVLGVRDSSGNYVHVWGMVCCRRALREGKSTHMRSVGLCTVYDTR